MQKKSKNFIREYFELIVETAVFVFFVLTFVVQAFQIPSGSMIPKLLIGDFLLVNKMAYVRPSSSVEGVLVPRKPIQRKDIVVFKWPRDLTKDFVKRVIGLDEKRSRSGPSSFISMTNLSTNPTRSIRIARHIPKKTSINMTLP